MIVKEVIELLMTTSHLILRGTSGKVYYNSDNNTIKTRQKYEEFECPGQPIDIEIKTSGNYAYPCIIIWFRDYLMSNKNN